MDPTASSRPDEQTASPLTGTLLGAALAVAGITLAILTIQTTDEPVVADEARISMQPVSDRFTRVRVAFGFMESPNVPKALALCRRAGWSFDIMATSFFLSRRHLRGGTQPLMSRWRRKLYMILARNADDASDYFSIPSNRVVEIGTQVLI